MIRKLSLSSEEYLLWQRDQTPNVSEAQCSLFYGSQFDPHQLVLILLLSAPLQRRNFPCCQSIKNVRAYYWGNSSFLPSFSQNFILSEFHFSPFSKPLALLSENEQILEVSDHRKTIDNGLSMELLFLMLRKTFVFCIRHQSGFLSQYCRKKSIYLASLYSRVK